MTTNIYYFSATGNSLNVSLHLAKNLGDCNLIPISQAVRNESVEITSSRIGIIFPVFAWGMPRIVEEFVDKLSFNNKPYIFAIVTCVAIQGNTLKDIRKQLRLKGVDLDAGFAVKSGRSSLMQLNALDKIIIKLDRQRLRIKTAEDRMLEMEDKIKNLSKHKPETSSWIANIFGSMFHGVAINTFKEIDNSFVVDDSCKGCGNCAKVCPRSNIVIENNRPIFQHNCELCHACIQWCSNFAIKHPNFDTTLKQYRNPTIQITDLIIR